MIFPFGCTISKRNEIYASDHKNDCIYLIDFDLNILKKCANFGDNNFEFKNPMCLTADDDKLYVCDHGNSRILVLSLDFELIELIKLLDKPISLKILNDTLCFSCSYHTYFYDLKSKKFKKKFRSPKIGRISQINTEISITYNSWNHQHDFTKLSQGYDWECDGIKGKCRSNYGDNFEGKTRYRCLVCDDFDFCDVCMEKPVLNSADDNETKEKIRKSISYSKQSLFFISNMSSKALYCFNENGDTVLKLDDFKQLDKFKTSESFFFIHKNEFFISLFSKKKLLKLKLSTEPRNQFTL